MTTTRSHALAALVLALVAGCSGGGTSKTTGEVTASGPASDQRATVRMTDALRFEPNLVKAQQGTLTLLVDNSGRVPHNLVFADGALGRTGTVQGGATATLKVSFATPGTYRFMCTFHSGMTGQVVVTEKRS